MGDESTAGESQMSVASSELSIVDGGGGGGEGDSKRLMVLMAVCILMTLGISGTIVYSGILDYEIEEDGNESAAARPAGGNGTDSSGAKPDLSRQNRSSGTTFKHGHMDMPKIKTMPSIGGKPPTPAPPTRAPPARTPPARTPPTTTPKMEKRKGMLVCILGRNLINNARPTTADCDYTIFRDLTIEGGEVVGTYGYTSWDLFKKFISKSNVFPKPGVSFVTAYLDIPGSPISAASMTPGILKKLTDPPLNIRALGFLGIEYPNMKLAPLEKYFKVFKTALSNLDKAMTFISVVIRKETDGKNFVDDIDSFSDLDTIILETHITSVGNDVHSKTCSAHYMAYNVGNKVTGVPTFKIANKTVAHFRAKTWKFRIMFSLSVGVMVYVGDKPISHAGAPCDSGFLMDPSIICDIKMNLTADSTEYAGYIIWAKDNRHHFLASMDVKKTEKLMGLYVTDQSEGWALFNLEMELKWGCNESNVLPSMDTYSKIARWRNYSVSTPTP